MSQFFLAIHVVITSLYIAIGPATELIFLGSMTTILISSILSVYLNRFRTNCVFCCRNGCIQHVDLLTIDVSKYRPADDVGPSKHSIQIKPPPPPPPAKIGRTPIWSANLFMIDLIR